VVCGRLRRTILGLIGTAKSGVANATRGRAGAGPYHRGIGLANPVGICLARMGFWHPTPGPGMGEVAGEKWRKLGCLMLLSQLAKAD